MLRTLIERVLEEVSIFNFSQRELKEIIKHTITVYIQTVYGKIKKETIWRHKKQE